MYRRGSGSDQERFMARRVPGFVAAVITSFGGLAYGAPVAPSGIFQAPVPLPHASPKLALRASKVAGLVHHESGTVSFLGATVLPETPGLAQLQPAAAAMSRARQWLLRDRPAVELKSTATEGEADEITSYFVQTVGGVRIEGTYALAVTSGKTLRYARHFLIKTPRLDTTPAVSADDATELAVEEMADVAEEAFAAEGQEPELVVIHVGDEPLLAWSVRVSMEQPWEMRAVFIDAQSGSLLSTKKLSHDGVAGRVRFDVEPMCVGDRVEPTSMPYVKWNGVDYTDANGAFSSSRDYVRTRISLESPYVRLVNGAGRVAGPWTSSLKSGVNVVDVHDPRYDQIDPFYHVHRVRSWLRANVATSNAQTRWTERQLTVRVNIQDTCNAYYDGTLNFFSSGGGCLNTGRTSAIVYHEYGHGIHDHSPPPNSGLDFDGQVSEGVGDYIAATLTGNPNMRGIFACNDNFRSCVNTLTYCERGCDLSSRSEAHDAGQVICAVWWELRQALIARYGEEKGVATADRLHLKFLTRVGDMYSAYRAAIAADDDNDGDASNGTTHSCEINRAFANDVKGSTKHFPTLRTMVPCAPPSGR
jgi:hypothetical protein